MKKCFTLIQKKKTNTESWGTQWADADKESHRASDSTDSYEESELFVRKLQQVNIWQ